MPRVFLNRINSGDLGKIIKLKKKIPEELARLYLAEILLALEDVHSHNVVFRDLKPENVVIDKDGHARLTDFGLSKEGITDETLTNTFCGSRVYLAPEIVNKTGHNKSVDWYLFGLMAYEMIVGIPAYYSSDREEYLKNVKGGLLKIPRSLSNEGKDLVICLLKRDPTKRLGSGPEGSENIKKHPWFKSIDWDFAMKRGLDLPKPVLKPIVPSKIDPELFAETGKKYKKVQNWTIMNEEESNEYYQCE